MVITRTNQVQDVIIRFGMLIQTQIHKLVILILIPNHLKSDLSKSLDFEWSDFRSPLYLYAIPTLVVGISLVLSLFIKREGWEEKALGVSRVFFSRILKIICIVLFISKIIIIFRIQIQLMKFFTRETQFIELNVKISSLQRPSIWSWNFDINFVFWM